PLPARDRAAQPGRHPRGAADRTAKLRNADIDGERQCPADRAGRFAEGSQRVPAQGADAGPESGRDFRVFAVIDKASYDSPAGRKTEGDALVQAVTRRFRTSVEDAVVDKHVYSILKPANSDDLIREEDFVKDERLPYWADVWPSS